MTRDAVMVFCSAAEGGRCQIVDEIAARLVPSSTIERGSVKRSSRLRGGP